MKMRSGQKLQRISGLFFRNGCCLLFFCCVANIIYGQRPEIQVKKIWDKAPYNSFTSLIRFDGAFYCSFREGSHHVSAKNEGKVRVLRSEDGNSWKSIALLQVKGIDLRDPKLSVTPDHKIMVIMAGAVFDKGINIQKLFPMAAFSDKQGNHFSTPARVVLDSSVVPNQDWIWRVTWHHGVGYGIDYQMLQDTRDKPGHSRIILMQTKDGKYFKKVSVLPVNNSPNESTIRFNKNNEMVVLIRCGGGDKTGVLAASKPPYTHWECNPLDYRLGGPDFLFLNDSTLVIGSRYYGRKGNTTAVLVTDIEGKIITTIELPGGGDTGYPGLVIYKNLLWVSYYSSHEGKASIYLAKIPSKEL